MSIRGGACSVLELDVGTEIERPELEAEVAERPRGGKGKDVEERTPDE